MSMSIDLRECLDLREGGTALRVDRESGVIKGAKLLGWNSANGRTYRPEGVDPKLYEGRPLNCNHHKAPGERPIADRLGRIVNVRKSADGLYGDLEILRSHPLAPAVFEAAERMPGVFGLSHTARGQSSPGKGNVIDRVESVQSVDLVGDPATVKGLFESFNMKKKLSELRESLKESRPKYVQALSEMAEAGIMSPDASMDDPGAAAGGADHEQALYDAAKAVIDDQGLGLKEKLAKIKAILKLCEEGGGGSSESDGDEPTEESLRLDALTQLGRKGVKLTTLIERAVSGCKSAAEVKELVESLDGTGGRPGARSATPIPATTKKPAGTQKVTESKNEAETVPAGDGKAVGKWLAGGR